MKWTLNEPNPGDIVRVAIGNFYHYGIYVSDDEVIQFGLPPTDLRKNMAGVEVCSSNIENFLEGKFLEVGQPDKKEKKQILPPAEIIKLARSRIGEKGYHILYNNCEHFAFQCAFNKKVSSQVDAVRQMMRAFPFVDVYVEQFPFEIKNKTIFPKERQQEINNCKNEDVKNQKFFAWKLLERAIKQTIGKDISSLNFSKQGSKWVCQECQFSISHSQNLVAVAVARNAVGVDVELKDLTRFEKMPQNKILFEEENKKQFSAEELNQIWTVKEAVFKQGQNSLFSPTKINTLQEKYATKEIASQNETFYLTVATQDLTFVKFYLGNGLTFKI